MKGYNVLHPMGWDAFGLPGKRCVNEKNTQKNGHIKTLKQWKVIITNGIIFNWDREIATCHPEYYKHEQKFFIDMFKQVLLTKKAEVNWDPVDKTVLAVSK